MSIYLCQSSNLISNRLMYCCISNKEIYHRIYRVLVQQTFLQQKLLPPVAILNQVYCVSRALNLCLCSYFECPSYHQDSCHGGEPACSSGCDQVHHAVCGWLL